MFTRVHAHYHVCMPWPRDVWGYTYIRNMTKRKEYVNEKHDGIHL